MKIKLLESNRIIDRGGREIHQQRFYSVYVNSSGQPCFLNAKLTEWQDVPTVTAELVSSGVAA